MNKKIILFTKAPEIRYSKTRLLKYLPEKTVLDISRNLLDNVYNKVKKYNHCIYFSGNPDNIEYIFCEKHIQLGDDIGSKMKNAIKRELENNTKVLLMGSDFAAIPDDLFDKAFSELDKYDVVTASTTDGGFGLIGLKSFHDILSIDYSANNVYEQLISSINSLGLTHKNIFELDDIDNLEDLICFEMNVKDCSLLGAGEYNINFVYNDKVFRINTASQLNLADKQLEYEYLSLKSLQDSNVTPKVYSYLEKGKILNLGILSMEFLKGRELDYDTDMHKAAFLLSTVHNYPIKSNHFIKSKRPFKSMYDEFLCMYSFYKRWEYKNNNTASKIESFIKKAFDSDISETLRNPCIINTELNNRNFIIGETNSYIIDWEKPVIGEAEQDVAHFLVPTTTNWKTDIILSDYDIKCFVDEYEKYRKINYAKLKKYMMFNVIRGITWCSMAKVEYSKDRAIKNSETIYKIDKFLSSDFLNMLESRFIY